MEEVTIPVIGEIALPFLIFFAPSMVLMAFTYFDNYWFTPAVRAFAMTLFSIFWITQVPVYFDQSHPDVVNGIMSLLGAVFFLFIAVQFILDQRWNERTRSIEWLLRTTFITGSAYFIFENIPITQGLLIYVVAWLTYYVLVFFGHDVTIQSGIPTDYGSGLQILSTDEGDVPIRIVFACTAALALFLFSAAIIAVRTDRVEWLPWAKKELNRLSGGTPLQRFRRNGILNTIRMSDRERKLKAFFTVLPIIFITNVFRNVGVIAVTYGGIIDFYDAHNIYAKFLSLGMMMFLTWVLFEFLPELQEDLLGLFDLTKRVKKGMIVDGRLHMKYLKRDHHSSSRE